MDTTQKHLVPRDRFITAMRNVATSVTVVTTDGPAGCTGATVSAFSSVSADPPTVLVCLFAESRTAKTVLENKAFCVNVLAEDAHEIADRFAGRHDNSIRDRFSGISHDNPTGLGPVIDGATAFACELDHVVQSGSHLVVFGQVRSVSTGKARPLAYRDGNYQRVILNDHPVCAIS